MGSHNSRELVCVKAILDLLGRQHTIDLHDTGGVVRVDEMADETASNLE